jgi:hypothetical protein
VIYFRKEGRALGEVTKVNDSSKSFWRTGSNSYMATQSPLLLSGLAHIPNAQRPSPTHLARSHMDIGPSRPAPLPWVPLYNLLSLILCFSILCITLESAD